MVTIEMTKESIKKGEYQMTGLDYDKQNADFLIKAIDSKYELYSNKGIVLEGRGIRRYNDRVYVLTESAYKKVREKYDVMLDL